MKLTDEQRAALRQVVEGTAVPYFCNLGGSLQVEVHRAKRVFNWLFYYPIATIDLGPLLAALILREAGK